MAALPAAPDSIMIGFIFFVENGPVCYKIGR